MALVTLPDLRQRVQTFAFLTLPSSSILTVWIFAFHFLLVCLFEWDTLFPETCPFPQISHFLDIWCTSLQYDNAFAFHFTHSNRRSCPHQPPLEH